MNKKVLKSIFLLLVLCGAQVSYAQPTQASGTMSNTKTNTSQPPTISSKDLSTPSGTDNGYEYVDLGLSVKWATCNVGASSPTDYGDYFAWGETWPKPIDMYDNSTTYNKRMEDIAGNPNYDAATANWGGTWRMPTMKEVKELEDNCTTKWVILNGVKGSLVTSKINGNSIFLPAASSTMTVRDGTRTYWTSTPVENNLQSAYGFNINSKFFERRRTQRSFTRNVRPVMDARIQIISLSNGNINGHEYVDLGLSVKWATCNVGASSPEKYGNYYAWGEKKNKSTYTQDNCATWDKDMGDIAGNRKYDVATANWGGTWRMPTMDEFNEMRRNCTTEWITLNGVNGLFVTSKINGNSIFLPAAGDYFEFRSTRVGESGFYWSSSQWLDDMHDALSFGFDSGRADWDIHFRYLGLSVRPVSE